MNGEAGWTWVDGYILRWFARLKMVPHPSPVGIFVDPGQHATTKLPTKIFEHGIWQQIEVDDMQFGFMKG